LKEAWDADDLYNMQAQARQPDPIKVKQAHSAKADKVRQTAQQKWTMFTTVDKSQP
jgi:hypothetical protein